MGGSDTMLIWLGKNLLGQRDRQELSGPEGGAIELIVTGVRRALDAQTGRLLPDPPPDDDDPFVKLGRQVTSGTATDGVASPASPKLRRAVARGTERENPAGHQLWRTVGAACMAACPRVRLVAKTRHVAARPKVD
jgi:hypothetical protein